MKRRLREFEDLEVKEDDHQALKITSFKTSVPKVAQKQDLIIPLIKQNVWENDKNSNASNKSGSIVTKGLRIDLQPSVVKFEIGAKDGKDANPRTNNNVVTGNKLQGKAGKNLDFGPKDHEIDEKSIKQAEFVGKNTSRTAAGPKNIQGMYGLVIPSPKRATVIARIEQKINRTTKAGDFSIEDEAINSLIESSQKFTEDNTRNEDSFDAVPIMSRNTVPGILEFGSDAEKYRHDISMRPDECELDDYSRVPIEEFGVGLLRGMGWERGRPIGKNSNGKVGLIELKSRPSLLGLGATATISLEPLKPKQRARPGDVVAKVPIIEAKSPEAPPPRVVPDTTKTTWQTVGMSILIIEGKQSGLKGSIVEVQYRPSGTVIKVQLESKNEIVRVWADQIQPFKKQTNWLRPNILIRIISKSYKGGKYYDKYGVVQDSTPSNPIVKLQNHQIVDGVLAQYCETVIPKRNGAVMVVLHSDQKLIGQLAILLETSPESYTALIQLNSSFEVLTVKYDQICQFVDPE